MSIVSPPRAKVTPRAHPTARLGGPPVAQVAELVDAQVSGTCGRKVVEVRVFSWAPETVVSDQYSVVRRGEQVLSTKPVMEGAAGPLPEVSRQWSAAVNAS